MEPEVHEKVVDAAAREGVSVSAWITGAAREVLKRRAGLAAVEAWEKEHGRFSEDEIDDARRRVLAELKSASKVRRPA